MVLLVSVLDVRKILGLSQSLDESLIASAVYAAQSKSVPAILSYDKYKSLIKNLNDPILPVLAPALSYLSGVELADIVSNQVMPTQLANPLPSGDPGKLKAHYYSCASAALKQVYDFCEKYNVPYNRFNSTSFCSIYLGGSYGSNAN